MSTTLLEKLEKGAPVVVRCMGGHTRENLVWEDCGSVVLVCARDQFDRLLEGRAAPMPIGFRRADVTPANRDNFSP